MPDPGDSQPGFIESTRRFCSLFGEWICSLPFKQFADLAKTPSSPSFSDSFKDKGFSDRMEPIEISSSLGSEFDLDSDDEEDVSQPDPFERRILPNWTAPSSAHARDGGSHTQRPKPVSGSGRATHRYGDRHPQADSFASTSYAGDNRAHSYRGADSRIPRENGSISHARNASYEEHSTKRTLPPSLQTSGLRSKQNDYVDNLGSSHSGKNFGFYQPVGLNAGNSTGYVKDGFSRGAADDAHMFDSNRPRILPHSMGRGKSVSSTQYASSSDPLQMAFGEERVIGDERLIYQAALQDLSQPKVELDVPNGVLSVPLLRHQKIALHWMVEKESKAMHCLGGILADDQGLGKTISTIALIQKQRSLQMKFQLEKHVIHNAEALDLDDDDNDDKGKNTNVTKCKSEEVCNIKPETLNLDDDDDDDDNGRATPVEDKKMEVVNGKKCSSAAPSSRQTSSSQKFQIKRPAAGTLIVCPATVLRQWARELDDKVTEEGKLSALIYHGGNRTKNPHELAEYDVVLTTYAIVSNEVPRQPIVDEDDAEQKLGERYGLSSDFSDTSKKRKHSSTKGKKGKKGRNLTDCTLYSGALAKVNWFRVVLDEAQTIKNHRTQTARSCCGLRAKSRWCLSGTPIQNSIDEMFSYFRFLRHHLYSDFKTFCDGIKYPISRDPVMGYKKLQAVLKTLLLRRTKDTLLDGEPIICLPPKFINMKTVNFTIEERAFYSQLEAQSRSQFKEYALAGTVNQNYANILLMILRLRQACDHPLLVKGFSSEPDKRTNLEKARKLPRNTVLQLLNHLEESSAICVTCSDPAEDGVITICGHVFCYQCVTDYLTGDDTVCPARRCKEQLSDDVLFSEATLRCCLSSDVDDRLLIHNSSSKSVSVLSSEYSSSKIKAALDILLSHRELNSACIDIDGFGDTDANTPTCAEASSAKMENSSSQGPIKTIVFSQWTRMLDLFELSLNQHEIQYRRLDGSMSLVARDRAVREFNTDPEVIVMVMSLKAGNLGLNMVAASHVILLDLWWNPTTEDQAIDRAHRIGQTRPVTVSRITIKDTIEDRILALQEEKRKMVASAFGEDQVGVSGARLTIDDLKYLFMGTRAL